MFHIGQRVVCVKGHYPTGFCEALPQIGDVYTVRDIHLVADKPRIYLSEIRNPSFKYKEGFMEPCFHVDGFRPAVERPTDISIFTQMLNTVPRETVKAGH